MKTINRAELRRLLDYSPDTGEFKWKDRTDIKLAVNSRISGQLAGTSDKLGYRRIIIKNKQWLAHRLAWLYVYGELPPYHLDHINGDPRDNRIVNLRECSHGQNRQHSRRNVNNTSGFKGVCRERNKWRAEAQANGQRVYLGLFERVEDAAAAYNKFVVEHHGEFARTA